MALEGVVERVEKDAQVWQPCLTLELHSGIGEGASFPVSAVRVLPTLLCRLLHKWQCLVVAAQEEDDAAAVGDVGGEVQGILQPYQCLVQVDDVHTLPTAEDVGGHVHIATSGIVAQVDSGSEEVAEGHQGLEVKVIFVMQ